MNIDHNVQVRRDVGMDLKFVMEEFLNTNNADFVEEGYFVGKVVDNMDPEKLGRCKIAVFTVFDDATPPALLPWAIPEFGFIGSKKGSFIVPAIGTMVNVRFDKNEIHLPIYGTKAINSLQQPTNKLKNYPNNLIFFETDNGDMAEIDLIDRSAVFTHASGSQIRFDDGQIFLEQKTSGNTVTIGTEKIVITHFSGNTITVDATGITIHAEVGNISTEHGAGFLQDNGGLVIPSPAPIFGPFIAAPGGVCPVTGIPLTGQKCSPPTVPTP